MLPMVIMNMECIGNRVVVRISSSDDLVVKSLDFHTANLRSNLTGTRTAHVHQKVAPTFRPSTRR